MTGGGSGIGRGIALALAGEGASIVTAGRTRSTLQETCRLIDERGGRSAVSVCDITEPDDVDGCIALAVERFGGIDVLVNNATLVPQGTLLGISEELVDSSWRAGPLAAWRFMCRCHPYLCGGGSIINVSSGAAISASEPNRGIYAMIKSALGAVSRAAAMEWAGDGIRVNVIMPFAKSEPLARFMEREPDLAAQMIAQVPLGRVGDPEQDIGRAVVFLAGPDSGYMTGTTLPLDGGWAYLR